MGGTQDHEETPWSPTIGHNSEPYAVHNPGPPAPATRARARARAAVQGVVSDLILRYGPLIYSNLAYE